MHTFTRILKYGWLNFWRNIWVSSATIGIMILALSMIAIIVIGRSMTETFISSLQQKVDVSVYFVPDAKEGDILQAKSVLEARPEVRDVQYISRDQAIDTFKEKHKDNAVLMDSLNELGSNPLQATLNIKASQATQFESIATFLEGSGYRQYIDKINYRENQKVIDKIISISSSIERVGIFMSIVLGTFVVLVTFNTIRLAIYSAREEIGIMRLVGAGNWYIRGPFIVSGALYGLFAGIITLLLSLLMTWLLTPNFSAVFSEIDLFAYYRANFFSLLFVLPFIGMSLGIISSFIATRRYLHV
ncbi:MAG: ABC transporter permease [Candidatus Spechtbacteria bacterium]|nr:ABC transporter permease [Candidatus Spechtbacteria bacterium]